MSSHSPTSDEKYTYQNPGTTIGAAYQDPRKSILSSSPLVLQLAVAYEVQQILAN